MRVLRMTAALATVAGALIVSDPAKADFATGNELFGWCSATDSDPVYFSKYAQCRSFIIGVYDGIEVSSSAISLEADLSEDPIRLICAPTGATARQMRDIVTLYLSNHPETRHMSASVLIYDALKTAFPCRGTS